MRRRLRTRLGLVALTITSAHAEPPFRVRGTITSVDGNVLSVGVVPKVGIETPHLRRTQASAQLTPIPFWIGDLYHNWVLTIAQASEQAEPNKGAAEQHERPWLRDLFIPALPRL